MTPSKVREAIGLSNLHPDVKGYLQNLLDIAGDISQDSEDGIWPMANSAYSGWPMTKLPMSYLINGLDPNNKGYIRSDLYRSMLKTELDRRA